jgi:hypothetical protein
MKRKYLAIGVSILVVVLLVLGSLSNVVGYQSLQSSDVNDSPLFSIRIKKAINKADEGSIISNYLDKNSDINLQIPTVDSKIILVRNLVDTLTKMNKREIDRLQRYLSLQYYRTECGKIDVAHVIFLLKHYQSNNNEMNMYQINVQNDIQNKPFSSQVYTYCPIQCLYFNILVLIALSFIYLLRLFTISFCY